MTTYYRGVTGLPTIDKTPTAKLDYTFNWSKWLAAIDDTIISYSITVTGDLSVVDVVEVTPGYISVVATGGAVGVSYIVTCYIVTPTRAFNRSIVIKIVPHQ